MEKGCNWTNIVSGCTILAALLQAKGYDKRTAALQYDAGRVIKESVRKQLIEMGISGEACELTLRSIVEYQVALPQKLEAAAFGPIGCFLDW